MPERQPRSTSKEFLTRAVFGRRCKYGGPYQDNTIETSLENAHFATCFYLPDRFKVPCIDFILRGFSPSALINVCTVVTHVPVTSYKSLMLTCKYICLL